MHLLKRVHIKGYKSLVDVELRLEPLTVLIGANVSGKSNFLDALQLLAGLATSRTLKQAFDPPYRGKPLESFNIGRDGIKGLLDQDRLTFSIEADLQISDAVVEARGEAWAKRSTSSPRIPRCSRTCWRMIPCSSSAARMATPASTRCPIGGRLRSGDGWRERAEYVRRSPTNTRRRPSLSESSEAISMHEIALFVEDLASCRNA